MTGLLKKLIFILSLTGFHVHAAEAFQILTLEASASRTILGPSVELPFLDFKLPNGVSLSEHTRQNLKLPGEFFTLDISSTEYGRISLPLYQAQGLLKLIVEGHNEFYKTLLQHESHYTCISFVQEVGLQLPIPLSEIASQLRPSSENIFNLKDPEDLEGIKAFAVPGNIVLFSRDEELKNVQHIGLMVGNEKKPEELLVLSKYGWAGGLIMTTLEDLAKAYQCSYVVFSKPNEKYVEIYKKAGVADKTSENLVEEEKIKEKKEAKPGNSRPGNSRKRSCPSLKNLGERLREFCTSYRKQKKLT